ncbi:MAG: glycogen debranching enzyme family protein [Planctomycetes bacterium]|nr:glycogen debranching enzyme family protein [Planctomycetota bacterium]
MNRIAEDCEWLEADGLGGYAMGTTARLRTRRYHALLCVARRAPAERVALVADVDVWLQVGDRSLPLGSRRHVFGNGDRLDPDGRDSIAAFAAEPWPRWTFAVPGGGSVEFELFVPHERAAVVLRWRGRELPAGARLHVRPLLACRDHHALQVRNDAARTGSDADDERVVWQPYEALPAVIATSNGSWAAEPHWFQAFVLSEEKARGYEWREDLLSPGTFTFAVDGSAEAVLVLAARSVGAPLPVGTAAVVAERLALAERLRRAAFPSALHRAADAYLVGRGEGRSVIAGYPWFLDWGRDTFLALRGLCLATGRLQAAWDVLRTWLPHLQGGLLPNRFPDDGGAPEYNSVDAALWFAVAAHEFLERVGRPAWFPPHERARLQQAILEVVRGCEGGCRHGVRVDDDGLLRAGAPGLQMTWMDAKVGGRVVTPRIGKPVEVQALWIAALRAAAAIDGQWRAAAKRAETTFCARFWNAAAGCLFDVVDLDHEPGAVDAAMRPNQILAVGGMAFSLLDPARARMVVDAVERQLWTPLGLRTLAPADPEYLGRYGGDAVARDVAYHQGTAWPWLLGPFVQAWVRVRGDTSAAREEARQRFVAPLLQHLQDAGLHHVSEVADGDAPHRAGGAPFQAWSLGELLRLQLDVLAATTPANATVVDSDNPTQPLGAAGI